MGYRKKEVRKSRQKPVQKRNEATGLMETVYEIEYYTDTVTEYVSDSSSSSSYDSGSCSSDY